MFSSFWDYLRHSACDAVLAGVEDAARILDQGRSTNEIIQSTGLLRNRLAKAAERKLTADDRSANHQPSAGQKEPVRNEDRSPQPAATTNGQEETETRAPISLLDTEAGHLNKKPPKFGKDANGGGKKLGRKKAF